MVDTGEISAASDPRHYPALNPYLRRATRFDIDRQDEIDRQLQQVGLAVGQVGWVVITHLHTGHAGAGLFPRRGDRADTQGVVSAQGLRGRGRGYLPQYFPAWLTPRTVEFRANPLGPFPASYPLTEAGDVLLVPTPGHTYGHLSVIVNWLGRLELAPLGRLEVAPARSAGVACRLELAPPLTRPFFSLLPETGPHRTVTVSPSGAT